MGIVFQDSHGQTLEADDEVIIQPKSTGPQPIPDWLKNNFRWYLDGQITQKELLTSINWLLDNNYMQLSEKAAQEVQELRDQVAYLKERLGATNPSTNLDEEKSKEEPISVASSRTVAILSNTQPAVNNLISESVNNGTQNFDDWSNVILQIRNEVSKNTRSLESPDSTTTTDSVAKELQKIIVLASTSFDKESGIIDGEINLISGVPKIASLQEDPSVDNEIQEIERNYWLGKIGKVITKIESLQTGITALQDYVGLIERKLNSEDSTDPSLIEDIQRQKQKLEAISNDLTANHNVTSSIIENLRI